MRSPQLSPNSISALGLSGHAVAASARTAHSRIRQGGRLLLGSVGRVTVAGFSITAQLPIDGRWGVSFRWKFDADLSLEYMTDLSGGAFCDAKFGIGQYFAGRVMCCTQFLPPPSVYLFRYCVSGMCVAFLLALIVWFSMSCDLLKSKEILK